MKLKADRPHLSDYRHTDKHFRLVMTLLCSKFGVIAVCWSNGPAIRGRTDRRMDATVCIISLLRDAVWLITILSSMVVVCKMRVLAHLGSKTVIMAPISHYLWPPGLFLSHINSGGPLFMDYGGHNYGKGPQMC